MVAFLVLMVLSLSQLSSGQSVSVDDTTLVYGETGRITCHATPHQGGTLYVVRWRRDGTLIYTNTPTDSQPGVAAPGGGLEGRSDYQHLSNGSSTLIIHNVVNSDGGMYQCQAEFLGPSAEDTCQVTIVRRPTTPSISTPTNPVKETDRVVLTCEPDHGTRPFTYDFKRTDGGMMRGEVKRDQGTLTISQTHRDDQGNYSCQVKNEIGESEWSGDYRLVVDYPPESAVIGGYTNGSTVYSGDDITLTCTATGGRPFATSVQWTCPGSTSGHGSETSGGRVNIFTTKVLKSWHGKQCVCSTTQRALAELHTKRYVFFVSWPPEDPSLQFTPQLPWVEGNTYSATCQVTDTGHPACTYSWYKEGQSLQGTSAISLPVEKDDNGKEIKCVVQNEHTQRPPLQTVQSKETLRVQFVPRVTLTPPERNITKKENEELVLGCEAESNPVAQTSHFRWTHQSDMSVVRQRQGQKTWDLGQVSKEDAGTYTCNVSVSIIHPVSRALTGDKQLYLVVQFVHVQTSPASQEVTEYERLTVTCVVDAIPDDISFSQWIHNNKGEQRLMDSNTTSKKTAMLVFSQAQYYNAGTYTCRARNGAYQEMKTAEQQVIVRYTARQPGHPDEGRRVFTNIGQGVSLSIKVDAYPSTVTFTWYFVQENNATEIMEDGIITITSKPLESTLNITNVTLSQIGNYTVHGNNGVLNGSNFIFLVIPRDGPGSPLIDESKCFPTPVSVEIWWMANYDGGLTQTFSLYFREAGGTYVLYQSGMIDQGYGNYNSSRVTPLKPRAAYQFKVEAYNAHNGGSSASSNEVTITTLDKPHVSNNSLKVERSGRNAYLRWQKPVGAYDTQRIEQYDITDRQLSRKSSSNGCEAPACHVSENLTIDTTSYNVTGLTDGHSYKFHLVLFYLGDIVRRQGFVEDVMREPTHADALNPGIIAGVVLSVFLLIGCVSLSIIIFQRRRKLKEYKETEEVSKTNRTLASEEHQYENAAGPCLYENVKNKCNLTADSAYEELSKRETEAYSGTNYQQLPRPDEYELLQNKHDATELTYEILMNKNENVENGMKTEVYDQLHFPTSNM